MFPKYRYSIMLMAVVALLAAMWAGLIRMGWQWPALQATLPIHHGALMVAGFFGTLIPLERAVAMGKPWSYLSPLSSGIGALLVVFGVPGLVGPILMNVGSLLLVLIFLVVLRDHWAGYTVVMALGAFALFVGNLFWLLGWPVSRFVLWWAGFLVLTIAGERLELGRMLRLSRATQFAFGVPVALYLLGLVMMPLRPDMGVRLTGLASLGLAVWLLRYDIARRTVKRRGLTRFIAICLLSGYVWLAFSGILGMVYGGVASGPMYDAMLHAVFLGFVFSMVFGHAPIIFPAVLGLDIKFRDFYYAFLIALHTSLLLRIVGELMGLGWARSWGGLLNVLTLLGFLAAIIRPLQRIAAVSKRV